MTNIRSASIMVVTGENYDRVLMVRGAPRTRDQGKWMFPGGGIDWLKDKNGQKMRKEEPFEAAKREFREETGFKLPWLDVDKTTGKLYEFIRTHHNRTKTKIFLGFASHLDRNDLHNKYDQRKVKKNETDKAYSVCFSSLVKNDFKYWRSSKHSDRQYLRDGEQNSLIEMYLSDTPIGRVLRQIQTRADFGGCGNRTGKRTPASMKARSKNKLWNCDECQSGGLTHYGVTLGHPISQNEKVEVFNCRGCTQETKGGRRKKTRRRKTKRRKTKRRKTKRRKNKKRKKTRRRKHR